MKILIRNLPRTFSENGLKELFEAYAEVQSCTMVLDRKVANQKVLALSKSQKSAMQKQPYKALNGKAINGNKIRVKKAETTKNT